MLRLMSRSLNRRHPIIIKALKSLLPLLRRFLFNSLRFMDSLLWSYDDNDNNNNDAVFTTTPFSDPGESLFLVSFRWWKEAVCGGIGEVGAGVVYSATVRTSGGGVSVVDDFEDDINRVGFGEPEICLSMRREGEAGVSGQGQEEQEEEREGVSVHGDLALVTEWMFLTALKWHHDKDVENVLHEDNRAHDIFSIQIRLLYMTESNILVFKISQKDNEIGAFNRVHSIFCANPGMWQIWDFSGRTNRFLGDDIKLCANSGQFTDEILVDLLIYGLPCDIKDEEKREEDMMLEPSINDDPSSSSSRRATGSVDNVDLFSGARQSFSVDSGYCSTYRLGLTGLYNLGNTCFMNSAIQCLVHTPKLVDYFLGDFRKDLNFENPLGMNGKLALAFGDLFRKLWATGATAYAPRVFKSTISSFAPQFSGYNQHDSQEFLAFLLDGLHEDLNRVKKKPYIQAKDEDGRPDEEVADEYWKNHLSRNDSIIVDLYQGQYRSTLICPICRKLSVTFDPFMYLSLPLPCTTLRKMTLTVLSTDGSTLPHPVTITLTKDGSLKDLVEALGKACSLRDDETLIIAEIYNNAIFRFVDDPTDLIELIRDYDKLVAYRLPKDVSESPLVVYMHQQEAKSYIHSFPHLKKFGIPLLARISDSSKGSEIRKEFLKLINPLSLPTEEVLNDDNADDDVSKPVNDDEQMVDAVSDGAGSSDNLSENNLDVQNEFEFLLENGNSYPRCFKIQMNEPVPIPSNGNPIQVLVTWPEKLIQDYDTSILSLLPEVCKPAFTPKWAPDSVSLYKCVDAFLKEEPLGPEDMWYCPNCKEHRQASKKLDLWRLPDVLVIHLKRFSFNRFFKNKLETLVDFPIDCFDLSNYVTHGNNKVPHRYVLFAVSNHYGGMGGGHYTAFAKHGRDKWYEFDDSHVFPVSEDQIKTPAAYVLFYKRV